MSPQPRTKEEKAWKWHNNTTACGQRFKTFLDLAFPPLALTKLVRLNVPIIPLILSCGKYKLFCCN
jgi:hypothetical protein